MPNRMHSKEKYKNNQPLNPPRVEFGAEIDVKQAQEQNKRTIKQKNVTLDPRDNR